MNIEQLVSDDTANVAYTPVLGGWKCENRDSGMVTFVYLNPSTGSAGHDPDHTPNVFLYEGPYGDPEMDQPHHHYDIEFEEAA